MKDFIGTTYSNLLCILMDTKELCVFGFKFRMQCLTARHNEC